MPKSTWNGTINFALLQLPVSLYTAVRDQDVSMKQLCPVHHLPISMKRVCPGAPGAPAAPVEGEAAAAEATPDVPAADTSHEVAYADLVSGYEFDGQLAVFTAAELDPPQAARSFDIELCVPERSVDLRFFDKAYVVGPQERGAARAYALLREALRSTHMVALGKIALKSRQRLAALRVHQNLLMLQIMRWPDELVALADFTFATGEDPSDDELSLAEQLVDSLAGNLEAANFRDEYRETLQRMIRARLSGEEPAPEAAPPTPATGVENLVSMLQRSIAERKAA